MKHKNMTPLRNCNARRGSVRVSVTTRLKPFKNALPGVHTPGWSRAALSGFFVSRRRPLRVSSEPVWAAEQKTPACFTPNFGRRGVQSATATSKRNMGDTCRLRVNDWPQVGVGRDTEV